MSEVSDDSPVRGAELREENVFPELHECDALLRYYAMIKSFLSRLTRCPHTGADLAQETFFLALRYYGAKTPPRRLRGWLFVIAMNVARDYFRRQRRAALTNVDDLDSRLGGTESGNGEDSIMTEVDRDVLRKAIKELPPDVHDLIDGFYFDGKTCLELAEDLRIRHPLVKIRLFRARRLLRRLLKRMQQGLLP